MAKYRKKPVVIEAMQVPPVGQRSTPFMEYLAKGDAEISAEGVIHIGTLEGKMRANVNDWIITGVKGEMYPCKPDIFDATYEPAE